MNTSLSNGRMELILCHCCFFFFFCSRQTGSKYIMTWEFELEKLNRQGHMIAQVGHVAYQPAG